MELSCPKGINDNELEKEILNQDPIIDNQLKYEKILKNVLPYLGSNEGKIILAQVLIALKVEGTIKSQLTKRDTKMIKTIKESIIKTPKRKESALQQAKKLLGAG
tara:strand:- start:29 stop:343 length:315 start_codon:yes stop_codon:yes gene_type:complete